MPPNPYKILAASLLVPGAGHVWLGLAQRGMMFLFFTVILGWVSAKLMPESELNATTLVAVVRDLLKNKKKSDAMRRAARQMSVRNCAAQIANIVEEVIQ